ncbi:NUDIX hydrolase [Vibrio hippocampi]|uniref:GDP-mannose pyrophosphatase n=1 Tax=Vibrio hippocampi TaxID=654686 RepID=A0ABM8ZKX9_9VIBR|nr:NUDIX hydrolase [Vibrio hippocampi]CAH0528900.1 ADP-ribose pyrophosphatase [Vibrio hippocampi]
MTVRTLHQWKTLALVEETIILPNHQQITHTMIQHPGAAVILPIDKAGNIVLLRQYRAAIKRWLIEIPAGTMEHGENPQDCAYRELIEETGLKAQSLTSLGEITPLAGFCDETQYLFLAKDLIPSNEFTADDDEVIERFTLTKQQLQQAIIDGEITDAKTIACFSKAVLCGLI